ncbi:PorV/PorQ family protein, partial [bacterium]|nr:PorV/PorQ family protein [bacterium]
MKIKKVLFLVLISSVMAVASSSIGSATGQFLEVNMHTRNMGMGNAATSIVKGAAAFQINPAGMVDFTSDKSFDAYASYLNWPADISFGALGLAYDIGAWGVIGANIVYVNFGEEIRTTPEMPFGDGTFNMGAYSVGLSYSRFLTDKFSFGLNIKNVSENYDGSSYSQVAWDIGTLYRTGYRNFKLAMSILHFSKEATFSGNFMNFSDAVKMTTGDSSNYESWPLPMTFRTGISFDLIETNNLKLMAAFDMIHS